MRRLSNDTWTAVLGSIYVGLVTNVLLVVANLPAVALLVGTDPGRTWPLLALTMPLAFPALHACCAVFARFTQDGSTTAVHTFVRAWWSGLRRSLALGAMVTWGLTILTVDAVVMWGRPIGAVAIPVFVTLAVLLAATGLVATVALGETPAARLRDVLRASLYLAVRRWYLTAFSFAVLGLLLALFTARPAVALGLAAAPLLYVVWANTRFVLRPVLPAGALTARPA